MFSSAAFAHGTRCQQCVLCPCCAHSLATVKRARTADYAYACLHCRWSSDRPKNALIAPEQGMLMQGVRAREIELQPSSIVSLGIGSAAGGSSASGHGAAHALGLASLGLSHGLGLAGAAGAAGLHAAPGSASGTFQHLVSHYKQEARRAAVAATVLQTNYTGPLQQATFSPLPSPPAHAGLRGPFETALFGAAGSGGGSGSGAARDGPTIGAFLAATQQKESDERRQFYVLPRHQEQHKQRGEAEEKTGDGSVAESERSGRSNPSAPTTLSAAQLQASTVAGIPAWLQDSEQLSKCMHELTSLEQRLMQPTFSNAVAAAAGSGNTSNSSSSGSSADPHLRHQSSLYPVRQPLLTKLAHRCRSCSKYVVKPGPGASKVIFEIQHAAQHLLPACSLQFADADGSDAVMTAGGAAAAGAAVAPMSLAGVLSVSPRLPVLRAGHAYTLVVHLKNPLEKPVRVRLELLRDSAARYPMLHTMLQHNELLGAAGRAAAAAARSRSDRSSASAASPRSLTAATAPPAATAGGGGGGASSSALPDPGVLLGVSGALELDSGNVAYVCSSDRGAAAAIDAANAAQQRVLYVDGVTPPQAALRRSCDVALGKSGAPAAAEAAGGDGSLSAWLQLPAFDELQEESTAAVPIGLGRGLLPDDDVQLVASRHLSKLGVYVRVLPRFSAADSVDPADPQSVQFGMRVHLEALERGGVGIDQISYDMWITAGQVLSSK